MVSRMTSGIMTARSASALTRTSGRLSLTQLTSLRLQSPQLRLLPLVPRRCVQSQQIPPQFQQFSSPPPPPPRMRFRIFTLNRCLFLFATTISYYLTNAYVNTAFFGKLYGSKAETPEEVMHAANVQRQRLAFSDTIDVVKAMKSDPDWEEWQLDASDGPASESAAATDRVRLTLGPMGGVDGMGGGHRIFCNNTTGTITSIVFIGQSLSGWPMVVHGGALATILDEALGRCAIYLLEAGTAVTARLELSYKKVSLTNNYFVVTCSPELEEGTQLNGGKLARRKMWCNAKLAQVSKEGKTGPANVEARALFVVPQSYNLPKVEKRF